MFYIEWKDEYRVNNELIDKQNKGVFERANTFGCVDIDKIVVFELLNYLKDSLVSAQEELNNEERELILVGYPEYKKHKQLHNEHMQNLKLLTHELTLNMQKRDIFEKIYSFATNWMQIHIIIEDQKYKHMFINKGE